MKSVFEVLEQLKNTASSNEKLEILKQNRNNSSLQEFFRLAKSPKILFWIRQIPEPKINTNVTFLDEAMEGLAAIYNRKITGNSAKNQLLHIMEQLHENDAEVIRRIVNKDPECGVSVKTINKVWKKLIPEHPYMGALSCTEKHLATIHFPCYDQDKEDGLYIDAVAVDALNGNTWTTRAGNSFAQMCPVVNEELIKIYDVFKFDFVLNGELLVIRNGKVLDRKTGNGLLNSMQQGTYDGEPLVIRYVVWDMLMYEEWENELCEESYETRFEEMKEMLDECDCQHIVPIKSKIICNRKEGFANYKKRVLRGIEGSVWKNMDKEWKPGKHAGQVKLKIQEPVDLRIIGWVPHTKKPHLIGSFICESECGTLVVKAGSGLKAHHREIPFEDWEHSIIEVFSNGVIDSKSRKDGIKSLYLPTLGKNFEGKRDKIKANSLEEVYEKFSNALENM